MVVSDDRGSLAHGADLSIVKGVCWFHGYDFDYDNYATAEEQELVPRRVETPRVCLLVSQSFIQIPTKGGD